MSQANPQSDSSEDVPNANENSSGIVITNGPAGVDVDEGEDEVDAESDEVTSAEASASLEEEASTEPTGSVDEGSNELESDEGEGISEDENEESSSVSSPESETDNDNEEEVDADEANESPAVESEEDPEVEAPDEGEDTEVEAPDEGEDTMTKSESTPEPDSNTQEASVETGAQDLIEVNHPPSHFEATIESNALASLIDSVDVLVDECKVRIGEDRMLIRAVDPANVGMVDVDLEAEAFESYNTDVGLLGLNLERFADVVGLAEKGDLIHLEYDAQTRKLHISVSGVEYTLALIDPDSIRQEPDIPNLDLPCIVDVEGKVINRAVTASDMVSDHIALGTGQDGHVNQLEIEAEGDTDDVELIKTENDDEIIDMTCNGDAYSLFSLDYFKDLNKAIPSNTVVTLELGHEFPVKVHFDFENENGHATYMLAPRIQSD